MVMISVAKLVVCLGLVVSPRPAVSRNDVYLEESDRYNWTNEHGGPRIYDGDPLVWFADSNQNVSEMINRRHEVLSQIKLNLATSTPLVNYSYLRIPGYLPAGGSVKIINVSSETGRMLRSSVMPCHYIRRWC